MQLLLMGQLRLLRSQGGHKAGQKLDSRTPESGPTHCHLPSRLRPRGWQGGLSKTMFGHSRNEEVAKRATREQQALDMLRSASTTGCGPGAQRPGAQHPLAFALPLLTGCGASPRSLTQEEASGRAVEEGWAVGLGPLPGWLCVTRGNSGHREGGHVTVYLLHWMASCCPVRTGSRLVIMTSGAVVGRSTSASHPAETKQAVETRLARSGSGAAARGRL